MAQPSSEGRHLAPVSRLTSLLCCPLQVNMCHAALYRGFSGLDGLPASLSKGVPTEGPAQRFPALQERIEF